MKFVFGLVLIAFALPVYGAPAYSNLYTCLDTITHRTADRVPVSEPTQAILLQQQDGFLLLSPTKADFCKAQLPAQASQQSLFVFFNGEPREIRWNTTRTQLDMRPVAHGTRYLASECTSASQKDLNNATSFALQTQKRLPNVCKGFEEMHREAVWTYECRQKNTFSRDMGVCDHAAYLEAINAQ